MIFVNGMEVTFFFIGGEAWMTERVFRLLKTERVSALESWPSKMTMTIIDHD